VWTGLYAIAVRHVAARLCVPRAGDQPGVGQQQRRGLADVYVSLCTEPQQPFVAITNPPTDEVVSNDVTELPAGHHRPRHPGRSRVDEPADRRERRAGGAAQLDCAASLGEGVNLIRVHGTNSALNPNAASRDAATNSTSTGGDVGERTGRRHGVGRRLAARGRRERGAFSGGIRRGQSRIGPGPGPVGQQRRPERGGASAGRPVACGRCVAVEALRTTGLMPAPPPGSACRIGSARTCWSFCSSAAPPTMCSTIP
jgi:hypothetical protein